MNPIEVLGMRRPLETAAGNQMLRPANMCMNHFWWLSNRLDWAVPYLVRERWW